MHLLHVLQPNYKYGALLFMSMPSIASHHVDVFSMLHPPVTDFPIDPGGVVLQQVNLQINKKSSGVFVANCFAIGKVGVKFTLLVLTGTT